ncbi:hypothetical protein MXB_464 [Myxobolus squamalis]|nr:hypothetical protein MXB_464 [Myxobolus squamalis]
MFVAKKEHNCARVELTSSQEELNIKLDQLTKQKENQELIIGILMHAIRALSSDPFEPTYSFIERASHSSASVLTEEIQGLLHDSFENIKKLLEYVKNPTELDHIPADQGMEENSAHKTDIKLSGAEYLKFRALLTEYSFVKDRYSATQEDINKLQNIVNDLICEKSTINHRYEILFSRYNELKAAKGAIASPPPSQIEQKIDENLIEDLKADLKSCKDISSARLVEIEDIQMKYQDLMTDFHIYKNSTNASPGLHVTSSAEYVSLQYQYESILGDSIIV